MERQRKIEELADLVRLRLFTYDALPINVLAALSRIGDLGGNPRPTYVILPDAKMLHDEAYTDGNSRTAFFSQTTIEKAAMGSAHHRFTIAHELGHLALGHIGVRSRALPGHEYRIQASLTGVAREEAEANAFASAFLMPRSKVDLKGGIESLAKDMLVSLSAARFRLETLERLVRQQTGSPRPIPEKTMALIESLRKTAGRDHPRKVGHVPPAAAESMAIADAASQGFLSAACDQCGKRRLVREGGCVTCRACGDSNCN